MQPHELETKPILNLTLAEVEEVLAAMGEPKYRARQVLSWIYDKHVIQWAEMTNLPLTFREKLASQWAITTSQVEEVRRSKDGTTKLLIRLSDRHAIESVFIPEEGRSTVCLSTQVGCPIRCTFCASGKGGLKRNLTSGEILEQILHIFSALPAETPVRNVVLMGMGEPMLNYDNVMRAVRGMNAGWGFQIGARKITVSTVGIVKGIQRLAKEGLQVNLAISLHGADDRTRRKIVPSSRLAAVGTIVEVARDYFAHTRRRVSFEYVLIDKVNSSPHQARMLGGLLRGFPCFVNLIPLNPVRGAALEPPERRKARAFLHELEVAGIPTAIRAPRGSDISAACGQLAGEKEVAEEQSVNSQPPANAR